MSTRCRNEYDLLYLDKRVCNDCWNKYDTKEKLCKALRLPFDKTKQVADARSEPEIVTDPISRRARVSVKRRNLFDESVWSIDDDKK